jgi:hypothetical protein
MVRWKKSDGPVVNRGSVAALVLEPEAWCSTHAPARPPPPLEPVTDDMLLSFLSSSPALLPQVPLTSPRASPRQIASAVENVDVVRDRQWRS